MSARGVEAGAPGGELVVRVDVSVGGDSTTKDVEILMLRHQLAVARRLDPRRRGSSRGLIGRGYCWSGCCRPVVLPKLGHRFRPAMIDACVGSSDLPLRGCGAVVAGAVGQVFGVEERRDTGPAAGGRGSAPDQPEGADRLD